MQAQKRVELTKLISYILTFAEKTVETEVLESIFPDQIKSNDEFTFDFLNVGDSKNINDFPSKLKGIMDPYLKDVLRHGLVKKFEENNQTTENLSLYASVLYTLVENYKKLPTKSQYDYVLKLRDKLIIYISNNETIKFHGYKDELGWVKKDIVDSLVKFKTNKIILKLLADYFYINIFLFNVVEDKIYVVSENDSYDMFRKSILLVLNESTFEPLVFSGNSLLDNNSGPIKKMITVDKKFLILLDTNLKDNVTPHFTIKLSNLQKYIKEVPEVEPTVPVNKDKEEVEVVKEESKEEVEDESDNENEYEEIVPNESDANAYIKDIEQTEKEVVSKKGKQAPAIIVPQLVFNISATMKLAEMQEVAKKLNIDLTKDSKAQKGKKLVKTKKELMDEINLVLKK